MPQAGRGGYWLPGDLNMAAISHTPDPVHVGHSIGGTPCVSTAARHLAQMLRKPELGHMADADMEANAVRLVMCWNFCAGVPNSELEGNEGLASFIFTANKSHREQAAELTRLRSDIAAMREALVQLHDAALCIVTDGSARDSEAWFNKCRIAASEALAKGGQP